MLPLDHSGGQLAFKESGGSLRSLDKPDICPHLEQGSSSPQVSQPTCIKFILILSSHLYLSLPKGFFPSSLPIKTVAYAFPRGPSSIPGYTLEIFLEV